MKIKRGHAAWMAGAVIGALAVTPAHAGSWAGPVAGPERAGFVDSKPEPFLPKFELPKKPGEDDDQGGGNSIEGDPLKDLAESLGGITQDLEARQTGLPVQQKQQGVVAALDKLIEQIEKQRQQSGSGNSPGNGGRSNKPLPKSSIVSGPGGIGDLHAPPSGRKPLDAVSPRLREQIVQSQNEGFPPGYQQLLEQYYKRLAERRGEDSNSAGAPATPAAPAPPASAGSVPAPVPVTPAPKNP